MVICFLLIFQWIILYQPIFTLDNETALKASIDFLSDIPDPDDDVKTLLNTYNALLTKENMEHAGQYIKELQQLQSKYKSTHLHALLQALIEALKDHM